MSIMTKFGHTARRYYRSNGPVRSSDLADDAAGLWFRPRLGVRCLEKTTEPDRLEEVKVVTSFP